MLLPRVESKQSEGNRQQVDAVAFTRMKFPASCFPIVAVLLKDVRHKLLGQQRDRSLASLMSRPKNTDAGAFLDFPGCSSTWACAPMPLHFSNHHRAHVLSSRRDCDWTDDVPLEIGCKPCGRSTPPGTLR